MNEVQTIERNRIRESCPTSISPQKPLLLASHPGVSEHCDHQSPRDNTIPLQLMHTLSPKLTKQRQRRGDAYPDVAVRTNDNTHSHPTMLPRHAR